jgi:hypothetical protein
MSALLRGPKTNHGASTKLDETLEAKAGHTTPYKPANLTTIQTASR